MAHQWRGVLREYADRLDISDATPIVTLGDILEAVQNLSVAGSAFHAA